MNTENVELNNLSEDVFDQLMGESSVPESTVNSNTLVGSTAPTNSSSEDEVVEKEVKVKKKPGKTPKPTQEVPEESEEEVEEEPKIDYDGDISNLLGEDDDESEDEEDDSEDTDESTEEGQNVDEASFFKAKAKGLVERGIWVDFEELDSEEFEWSEDSYGQLVELQAQWKAENAFNERVNASGKYGQMIFKYIEDGGNPEDLVSIFQDMKDFSELDTSTESGKVALLRTYYVDELGWSEAKFKRDSNNWIDNEVLDEEVSMVQEKVNERLRLKAEQKSKAMEEYKQQQIEAQQKFANTMTQSISARKDIPLKERNEILADLLTYDQKLPNGNVVNKFTLDFMKLQSDPEKHLDLILFVRNPEKYIQRISKEVETKTNKKNWNLIKGGAALKKSTGSKAQKSERASQKGLQFDYKSILNNNSK